MRTEKMRGSCRLGPRSLLGPGQVARASAVSTDPRQMTAPGGLLSNSRCGLGWSIL